MGLKPNSGSTPQDVEAVREYELDSFENQLEPTCQADMQHVIFIDRDGRNPICYGRPAPQFALVVFPCNNMGDMPPFKWDGAIERWRKTVVAFSNDRMYMLQRDDPMHTLIPQLNDDREVEIMVVVARPMRGEEGIWVLQR